MFESATELAELQLLLDASIGQAGPHMLETIDETRRPSAVEICDRMRGMALITVATVTKDCRPISGPFDGYLIHGSLWFTSSWEAVRIRHLQSRRAVSATYLPSTEFALWAHGDAELHQLSDPSCAELRQAMIDHYLPIQGPSFQDWIEGLDACAVRLAATRVIAFRDPS